MADTDKDFGGTAPTVTSSDGWEVIDSGMERDAQDVVSGVLSSQDDVTDAEPSSAAPETPPAAEVQTAEPDDDGNVESTGKPAAAASEKPAQSAKPAEKPRRQVSGRIEELKREVGALTAQKYQTRAEVEEAKAEHARLLREIAALKAGKPVEEAARASEVSRAAEGAAPKAESKDGALARPVWKDFEEAGKSWDEFLEAQDQYLEERIARSTGEVKETFQRELDQFRTRQDQEAHEARIDAAHRVRMSAVRDAHKDEWPEILANLDGIEATPFIADVVRMHPAGAQLFYEMGKDPEAAQILNTFEWTTQMFDAVMALDNPSALLLHLAHTEGEFERIRQMKSAQAMFALGVLSKQLDSEPAQARVNGSRPKGKAISKAPAPIRPVGGASAASDATADGDDDEDLLSWIAKENERDDRVRSQFGRRF